GSNFLAAGIALEHFGFQLLPDLAVEFVERGIELNFGCVARPRERHAPVPYDARGGACGHDHDPIGQGNCFFQIVGDEQNRLSVRGPQVEQQVAYDLACLGVQWTEWLIHKEDLWITDQNLRETDALALSTGQHMRIAVGECIETDASKPLLRACLRVVCTYPGDVKADRNILDGCLPWKECVALKQVTGLHVQGGERLAKNIDFACGRREQPGGYIKQRGFAATPRPHHFNEFAVPPTN